ncbi:NADH-quinone oxidoreductase subunit L [Knoellia sinensis KCTC 19936]|uniref:NADH-quinone oxidoreductase subunit L n=1 Tax=Knoellia sinensis KCTC 19936 TaxID=1385520 RepID=A0A0A0JDY0_9MICO|nr:NADH-quinone oxidoreductase subunit L [Knoellia sinensis]KGN33841.1 NADH-quinone oxidoreductase subunit L [Knoellia sinensis KCTC 19936]
MSALWVSSLLVLIPVLAALLTLGLRRTPHLAARVASGAAIVSVVVGIIGMAVAPTRNQRTAQPSDTFHVGDLEMPLALGSGPTTAAVAAIVALVAAVVLVFTQWYLDDDDRLAQFAATVSLFTAAMMLVVHARDLVLTLIGWEVMGWCSYLLIGHWSRKESARRAAYKSFIVTRVADIGFVLGIVGLSAGAGSTGLDAVVSHWTGEGGAVPEPWTRSVLLALVVIGVLGKSAQFPFQDWLPDAMEGPTPASALIHAATMVAAGTVVLAQLFPVLVLADGARWLLGIAVAMTMVGAAALALGQSDLKRLLAWSTVSQVAIMLSALATATEAIGPDPGLFHLWSHAIFKSLLFLTIGWLSVVAGSTLAMALRGSGHVHQLALVAWLFGLLALAGAPFVVGGLSKEHVIVTAYEGAIGSGGPGVVVLAALLVTVVLTAAYATRAYLVVAAPDGERSVSTRSHAVGDETAAHELDETAVLEEQHDHSGMPSAPVLASLALLTVLTVVGGLVMLTGLFNLHRASMWWMLLTALLIGIGAGVVWLARGYGDPRNAFVRTVRQRTLADNGFGFDTAYRRLVAGPVLWLARIVEFLDREVVDGYVRGAAASAGIAGWLTDRGHRREAPSAGVGLVALGLIVAAGTAVLTWR